MFVIRLPFHFLPQYFLIDLAIHDAHPPLSAWAIDIVQHTRAYVDFAVYVLGTVPSGLVQSHRDCISLHGISMAINRMAVPDQQHAETRTLQQIQQENLLIDMQMEALGVNRREGILTGDYPEKTAAFVPAASIERLANLAGTKENKLALKVTKNLNAWNSKC